MFSSNPIGKQGITRMTRTVRSLMLGMAILALFVMMVFTAHSAQAATVMCLQSGGVVDEYNPATFAATQNASFLAEKARKAEGTSLKAEK